jgi:hypothetical protein
MPTTLFRNLYSINKNLSTTHKELFIEDNKNLQKTIRFKEILNTIKEQNKTCLIIYADTNIIKHFGLLGSCFFTANKWKAHYNKINDSSYIPKYDGYIFVKLDENGNPEKLSLNIKEYSIYNNNNNPEIKSKKFYDTLIYPSAIHLAHELGHFEQSIIYDNYIILENSNDGIDEIEKDNILRNERIIIEQGLYWDEEKNTSKNQNSIIEYNHNFSAKVNNQSKYVIRNQYNDNKPCFDKIVGKPKLVKY